MSFVNKKALVFVLAFLVLGTAVGCQATTSESGDTLNFSYWTTAAAGSQYYPTSNDNPVFKYLESRDWDDGNGGTVKMDFDFVTPISGSETSNIVTLLSTGEYTDIVNISYYLSAGSVPQLYEEGIALDLTEYVQNYMPNYLAYLDAHPNLAKTATNMVNGEAKYLQLYNYEDVTPEMWGGYSYRRDWILEYGVQPATLMTDPSDPTQGTYANPNAGQPFTGGYDAEDVWSDDIVFPSGNLNPVYISDWEWMLQIFEDAIDAQNIIGGYPMSLYYPGYLELGNLVCAFGGGGGSWYLDDDTVKFGGTGNGFRTYLECMSGWYDNGWIDEAFAEHTDVMFYEIDLAKIYQGKVGLWYGTSAALEDRLDVSNGQPNSPTNGYTNGIFAMGARQPINDKYGSEDVKNVTPFTYYQTSLENTSIIITDKAEEKNLVALCKMLDFMYSEEGGLLKTYGLNKEQYESVQDEFYTAHGLLNGSYVLIETEAGIKAKSDDILVADDNLRQACIGHRFFGLSLNANKYLGDFTDSYITSVHEWVAYEVTGAFLGSLEAQMNAEQSEEYGKIEINVRDFMARNVPNFIMGIKDPENDADWNAFVNAVNKYKASTNTEIMQSLLDQYN